MMSMRLKEPSFKTALTLTSYSLNSFGQYLKKIKPFKINLLYNLRNLMLHIPPQLENYKSKTPLKMQLCG